MQLFPYQIEGAKFLAERGRALLADEMGLGKSAQAIVAAAQRGSHNNLVVCPASLVENWRREIKKFDVDHAHRSWMVVSYDRLVRTWAEKSNDWHIDVLILDEAHYLKNPKAKRTKAIFGPKCDGAGGLVEQAKDVFCLTGTPTPNNPSELWPMLRAVMPGAIERDAKKPASYWQFVTKYCRTQDTGFGIKIVGGKNLGELKERIAPFVLRRKKDEVLEDLPPIRFAELPLGGKLTLPQDCADEVRLLHKTIEEHGVAGLREIAPHVAQLRRLTGLAKVGPVVEWVDEWREAGGRKLVLFAHHRAVIDALSNALGHAVVVSGSTESFVRQAAVDSFQNDPEIDFFIGQIQAAGTGITLTAASDMLFVEQDWTPGNNLQAAMRIHRVGQRNACLVRAAMLTGSIDEQIQRALLRKLVGIEALFG